MHAGIHTQVRAHVLSDTNKRVAELKHANSLDLETYMDNVTVSWRCRLPYGIYKWIVRRILYTGFAFQNAPTCAKLLCCCIFCPRCCCGGNRERRRRGRRRGLYRSDTSSRREISRLQTAPEEIIPVVGEEKKVDE